MQQKNEFLLREMKQYGGFEGELNVLSFGAFGNESCTVRSVWMSHGKQWEPTPCLPWLLP